ncbi:MAG: DNA gyrase inhibitor YacG [Rhodobacteraceae bacterium CG17_big_fil_post_rev_8_21_14_2_50_63_15]|nr:DNA gyrase inhibitor YacG [Roseovarius sp.]PIV79729.1 MAG: DNA gyrase inhibitor YacG [Rhodobacteraceae bacterium CG17_big_fil_post_rev_8_21_14_2_50_63_15]
MTCPICRKASVAKYRPFCSRRCADIDLGKWFGGAYAVPTDHPGDDEEAIGDFPEMPRKPH